MPVVDVLPRSVRWLAPGDPAALAEVVGEARVVAIGENNHGIREFGELRARLVRYLVDELGFTVVALESGFAEGALVDAWLHSNEGALEDIARDGFTFRAGDATETRELLHGLREQHRDGARVRFVGLDLPGSGGSPEPALREVREHLATWGPEAVALVDAALDATRPYAAANNGAAPQRYEQLDTAARDQATAALARLVQRVEALGPAREHRIALHHARGALRLDEQLREFAVLFAPDPPARVVSSRDVYMAETVRLVRELVGGGERVVLLGHNGHFQRVPFTFLPGVTAPSAGTYLAGELGEDYVVVGMTALAGTTTGLALDDTQRHGMGVHTEALPAAALHSVERAVAEAGHREHPVLLNLRPARGAVGPSAIRHATTHIPVDVLAGYDALYCLPEQHTAAFVAGAGANE
jgi:erythromycin esterase